MKPSGWPRASTIETRRLTLEPLRIEHADEMVSLLRDESLYEFTGGRPKTLEELRQTYTRQVAGRSPDGLHGWLNWIARDSAGSAVGSVQATLHQRDGPMTADVAWVIGSGHQGRGYAKESANGMLGWLREQNVRSFAAHIYPGHEASIAIARYLGFRPTRRVVRGEVVWIADDAPGNPG
jgi:RimJ/RimL family protein N-acetyltransferase